MNVRLVSAVAAILTVSLHAQVATVNPPQQKIKWDDMDLGPFFTGSYKVKDSTSYKGLAVAVGTKEAPATMLYDTELLRFHAAWEGGLASFSRGRGGLEGTIKNDGELKASSGWANGWGTEIKEDPRPNHQGQLPGTKWRGVFVHGDKTLLSYFVGKQNVLELPASETRDGQRIFTRTFHISASTEGQHLLVLDGGGLARPGANGAVLVEKDGKVTAVGVRGTMPGGKIVVKDGGRIIFQIPPLKAPATFQIAFGSGASVEADKLSVIVSTLEVASSKIAMGGLFTIARAMASRCFWPPENR